MIRSVRTSSVIEEGNIVRTLVLGLGNPILTDDGVGIRVALKAKERCRRDDVTFAEASVGGMRLLDVIRGFDRLIMVDAIQTGEGRPGDIYRLRPDSSKVTLHTNSSHDLSLPGALALGRGMGMSLPKDSDIVIIAVEAEDVLSFGEECTPDVSVVIPCAVDVVLSELGLD
jgi:hydrogenase maturation protease